MMTKKENLRKTLKDIWLSDAYQTDKFYGIPNFLASLTVLTLAKSIFMQDALLLACSLIKLVEYFFAS